MIIIVAKNITLSIPNISIPVGANLLFVDVVTGFPGSMHNS